MKTRLAHVRANVRDLDKAVEWYESVLGFECDCKDIHERGQGRRILFFGFAQRHRG